jgi:hypothetical protein
MFGTIRKHQSWLWFIIIAVMVISMITWTNQLGKSGNERAGGDFGIIDGHTVTQTDYINARNEAMLMYLVRYGQWPDSGSSHEKWDEARETYFWLFFVRKLDEFNIRSDKDAVAQFANVILREFGRGEQVPLETFVDQILKPKGLTADDFQRFAEHYLSRQQLESVIGVSAKLLTPQEIQALYIHEYQQVAVDAAFFSASNYLAKVPEPSAAELGQFYTNQQASYREPDQMQVKYLLFNVTNFMADAKQQIGVTNLDRETQEALVRLGTNTLRYGKTPEEVHAKISEILVQETAISNAYQKAVEFQNELAKKGNATPDTMVALAKEKGLTIKTSKPFDKEYGPSDLNLGPTYPVAELFNLSQDDPFVPQPIRGADGVYIVALDKFIPSRVPPLAEIHSRVVADYKMNQALRLAEINGHIFSQSVTNQMAQGKTFTAVAAAMKVDAFEVKPFSLNTETVPQVEDLVDLNRFKQVVFGTPVGRTSEFVPVRDVVFPVEGTDGGFVVHVREKLPIDEAKMKAALPEFANLVRQRREAEAFQLWANREASISLANIPMLQQQPK